MQIQDIIDSIPTDLKVGEVLTRKWTGGKVVEESRSKTGWKPNADDLDVVLVGCECGNQYDLPRDCLGFMNDKNSYCGQCGHAGKMSVVSVYLFGDLSWRKQDVLYKSVDTIS
jgi:hypothetical protein